MVTGSVPVWYKFIVENKGWESGPGRNRTCDMADNGVIPTRLQINELNIQMSLPGLSRARSMQPKGQVERETVIPPLI